jgi:DNA-binding NtrC family response regulator
VGAIVCVTDGFGDVVRSGEWQRVRGFAEAVRDRPAGLVVEGEAGSGKSTL